MRTFLAALVAVTQVLGEEVEIIAGHLNDDVLLPCNCTGFKLDTHLKWQKEEPKKFFLWEWKNGAEDFNSTFKPRAEIFVAEGDGNCSVLLKNLTVNDQGQYRCRFHLQGLNLPILINLTIYARYDLCQSSSETLIGGQSAKVFQCDVKGPKQDAEIQWWSGGERVNGSSAANATRTTRDCDERDRCHFRSKLITPSEWSPEITCDVKTRDISPAIYRCQGHTDPVLHIGHHWGYYAIIPAAAALLLLLLLLLGLLLLRCRS